MKDLNELVCDTDSAWELIKQWISQASISVNILPVNKLNSGKDLVDLQITTRSPMGSILYETGGILLDNGWLRFLGSGCNAMKRSLSLWNEIDNNGKFKKIEGAMLVADDILGGFFAINGGAFEGKIGDIHYLAPETLKWESLNMAYSNFLYWAFTGDIGQFYKTFRWEGWEKEIENVSGDQGILFYPFLWSGTEGIYNRSRSVVSIEELWNLSKVSTNDKNL
jgi:hypothetical protein